MLLYGVPIEVDDSDFTNRLGAAMWRWRLQWLGRNPAGMHELLRYKTKDNLIHTRRLLCRADGTRTFLTCHIPAPYEVVDTYENITCLFCIGATEE